MADRTGSKLWGNNHQLTFLVQEIRWRGGRLEKVVIVCDVSVLKRKARNEACEISEYRVVLCSCRGNISSLHLFPYQASRGRKVCMSRVLQL